jgi:hypothetical protein
MRTSELESIVRMLKRSLEHTDEVLSENKDYHPYCYGYMKSTITETIKDVENLIKENCK